MANVTRNFVAGKMNKVIDQRLVPDGEYIDAQNIRMGSTENSEIGVIENTKGNVALSAIQFQGSYLSTNATCIGAYQDSANETIYWFVHDPTFDPLISKYSGKLDLIMSFNVLTGILTYHVISIWTGSGPVTTLNFNPNYVITGVNKIGDLLFFTDDYNPPRFINVKRTYPNPIDLSSLGDWIDGGLWPTGPLLLEEALLVVKRPPTQAPTIIPSDTSGQENYMESRFICFAYRYRYEDGEYSATSQWTAPVFVTKDFQFDVTSMLNDGMINAFNQATITYNTGSLLVKGIDLLFKNADDGVIKVIEKIDKAEAGLSDLTDVQYTFSNSKIYTILPSSEILRTYDNVPKLAKAQTIMGNRLMYGNYVEGYDLIDKYGLNTKIAFTTTLVSTPLNLGNLTDSTESYSYSLATPTPTVINETINDAVLVVDLTNMPLTYGTSLSIDFTLTHRKWALLPLNIIGQSSNIDLNISFYLPRDYASVYEMLTSCEFQSVIGIGPSSPCSLNINDVANAAQGTTLTDAFNGLVTNSFPIIGPSGTITKYYSAISGNIPVPTNTNLVGQPFEIITSPGSNLFKLAILPMAFADDLVSPTRYAVEFFAVSYADASYQESGSDKSLHSNRGYEIGMVYMDEYNRSTTALVSNENTQHVPCSYSINKNQIYVTVPVSQRAPAWAKRFKFVCRADRDTYETIYSNIYIYDPVDDVSWILLEGENMRKVEVGNTLIVKADSSGPLNNCVYTTVLEKEAQPSDFIPNSNIPAGLYIKIKPNNFSTIRLDSDTLSKSDSDRGPRFQTFVSSTTDPSDYPVVQLSCSLEDPLLPGSFIDFPIRAGASITLKFDFKRQGTGTGNNSCEKRNYTLSKTLRSSSNYDNIEDYFNAEVGSSVLNSGTWDIGGGGTGSNVLLPGHSSTYDAVNNRQIPDTVGSGTNYYQFYRDSSTNELFLLVSGTNPCTGISLNTKKYSYIDSAIYVFNTAAALIFETQPIDTAPDLFYENELSFPISVDGDHESNGALGDVSQNIAGNIDGYFNTGFFNCFTFGNGAESYRIQDSATGHYFSLGNRVNAVAAQDYMEIDRYADITYSGIYNQETNVNRLNEFNLGLVNYKSLEYSFGELFILDGRETDVRVLQEDKISYVLAGKNLLSDSIGGGAVTSVPEVLGTQIARIENYGISFNPESYVKWGSDTFFTDVKRGVVLQLKGDSYSNEQLAIISEFGMRTWFRDTFISSFNTQKLGAFDPYMNEYVLSTNDRELPLNPSCVDCGTTQTLSFTNKLPKLNDFKYCVDVGNTVGDVVINYNVLSIDDDIKIEAEYDGTSVDSGIISSVGTGSITIFKNDILNEKVDITLFYAGTIVVEITVNCPTPEPLRIIEVVYTSGVNAGETIHVQYDWTYSSFLSPLQSRFVSFLPTTVNPFASWYNDLGYGTVGTGGFPPSGANMTLYTNQISPDTYIFNPNKDEFRYFRTNTLYGNNPADLLNLYNDSYLASPITTGPTINHAGFTVPPTVDGDILYLIWDLRDKNQLLLCYDPTDPNVACCECVPCESECILYRIENISNFPATVVFPSGTCANKYVEAQVTLDPYETNELCVVNNNDWYIDNGQLTLTAVLCDCTSTCDTDCKVYTLIGNGEVCNAGCDICNDQGGGAISIYDIPAYFNIQVCLRGIPRTTCIGGFFVTTDCGCCAPIDNSNDINTCTTYRIVPTGVVSVSYIDCNGNPVTFTATQGNTYDICVQKLQQTLNTDSGPHSIWGSYQPNVTAILTGSSANVTVINSCDCKS